MSRELKQRNKKFDTSRNPRTNRPTRSKPFSEARRISLGRDRSLLKAKHLPFRPNCRLTGGITLRSRKLRGVYRRIIVGARLRHTHVGATKAGGLGSPTVRFLARFTSQKFKRTIAASQVKSGWSLLGTIRTRGLRSALPSRSLSGSKRSVLADSRRLVLRAQAHLHRSALFSARRRVFLAQRSAKAYRVKRALKRRVRRVRPKTRFRYFGIFGKRRRRAERRDRLQLMRLVAAFRKRSALGQRTRLLRARAGTATLRAHRALTAVSTQLPCVAGRAFGTLRIRLARVTTAQRLYRVRQRRQRSYLPTGAGAVVRARRKKKTATTPVASKFNTAVGPSIQLHAPLRKQNARKGGIRPLLKSQQRPLSRALLSGYGAPSGVALPFQRTLHRAKSLFIGRPPTLSKRVVEPPQGTRRHWRKVTRKINFMRHCRRLAKWRRAALRGYSSRLTANRGTAAAQLSRWTPSLRRAGALKSYQASVQPRCTTLAATLLWLRRRRELKRKRTGGLKAPLYATPFGLLRGLRASQQCVRSASRTYSRPRQSGATFVDSATEQTLSAILAASTLAPVTAQDARYIPGAVLRSRKQFEGRLYRRQLKLRLPRTNVTRRNLRHGGHVLFARNTLKAPTNLVGKRNLLLAPSVAWALSGRASCAYAAPVPAQLRRLEKRDDILPRAWKRPPSFLNSLRASRQRERRKALTRRRKYYSVRRLARLAARAPIPTRPSHFSGLTTRLVAVNCALRSLTTSAPSTLSLPALARLTAYRSHLEQLTRANTSSRRVRPARATGVIARTIFKKVRAASAVAGRVAAEKQVQSVRQMLRAERGLSAWSPLYPLKWRRWSSPRSEGLPLPRTWASHKMLRQRALLNESLTYRGLPERRYVDLGYSHLQYYRGSAAGIGYERFRRAHRPRSLYNRWWKPVNYAVPFENPYSRRALNATRYATKRLTAESLPRAGAPGTEPRALRGEFYPVRYPPANIPWRNYKFRKPKRRAAPYNIQRWTRKLANYVSVTNAPHHRVVTLQRSKHDSRRLERLFPKAAVWSSRRWEALEPATATTSESRLLESALTRIPLTAWSTLRRSARSAEQYAVLRRGVFSHFRRWSRASLVPSFEGGRVSAEQQGRAVEYLRECIAALAATLLGKSTPAFITRFSSKQLKGLEQHSYARLVQSKKDRFWSKRQLPTIQKECTSDALLVLARENVPLYKRWLRGAERYLRRSQSSYLPTTHDHSVLKRTVSLGRRRPRFPASGRRRASYDSMLHAFTRRTSPARFRRVANTRFQAVVPRVTNNFKVNQTVYEQSRALRRRRLLSKQLSLSAYLSPTWRELLAHRFATLPTTPTESALAKVNASYPNRYGQPRSVGTKRRFASLPVNAAFKHAQALTRASRSANVDRTRAMRIALLRCALRRRRMERTIFDLKKHALARRLPKDQVLPPWRTRRSIRRRSQYATAGDWGATALKRRPSGSVFWTLHHLGSVGPRLEDRARAALSASYYGEALRLPLVTPRVTRKGWSRAGFNISPKLPRKLRRRKPDSHLRQRRRRRLGASDMSVTRFNHWSERPQLAKLHRASAGRVGPLLERFTRRLVRTRRNRRCWLAAASFSYKGPLRRELPHQRLIARALRQNKLLAVRKHACAGASSLVVPATSKELYHATPLRRPGKSRQLIRSAVKRRSKLQALQALAHGRASKKQKQFVVAAKVTAATAGYVGRLFLENFSTAATVTPLFFQNHTKTIVKTEATLERERLANIASKELRYKITAQYSEGLTTFIPALISQMISRRAKTQKLSRRNVKHIVSSTYWSLRVYLNVDPFDARFYLRDGNYEFRSSLEQEMLVRAKEQITEQPQRAALRRRFQPVRLHLAHSSDRFRFDWLREFFPLKHSLFQEDPDDYGNLPIATARIRRLLPSGFGIYNWETAPVTPSLETRSRQILTLRYSRATPRVEAMLQGARRLPAPERPLSATIGSSAGVRGSFFSRPFSSYAHRATALLGRLIYQRRRFTGVDEDSAPTFTAVAGRYRVKARVEARGRTNFSFSSKGTMVGGALDPRFLRYKSPRSRQYLLRLPESFALATSDEKRAELATYRARRCKISVLHTRAWTRTARRAFAFNPVIQTNLGAVEATLQGVRDGFPIRRNPAHLEAQAAQAQARIKVSALNDFPARRKSLYSVWAKRAVRAQLRDTAHYRAVGGLSREQAATSARRTFGQHLGVESARAILQHRTPAHRSFMLEYKAERVIAETPFELVPRAARYARRWRDLFGRSYIFLQMRRRARIRSVFKKQIRLKALTTAVTTGKPSAELIQERATLGHFRTLPHLRATLRGKFSVKPAIKGDATRAFSVIDLAPLKKVRTGTNFFLRVGGRVSARAGLSKEALEIEAIRRQTPFEVYRPKLWHKLTNRWMKRERTMRFWLKDTKRWLRDPWLSEIVACRPKIKGKRPAGELALIEQQIGQYVAEVDDRGIDIPEEKAPFREREEFIAGDTSKEVKIAPIKRGPRALLAAQRRAVSVEARKKPIPTLWLANHEYRDVLKEVEENLTKTPTQRVEEEQAKVKEYWRRKKAGLPQLKERRLPLKHPADHWLPAVIWREIQRRARRLEWRESDELFFRKGFRNAFRFFPGERNRAPWLEALMYNRSLFSTHRGEFRRRQFPREQKKYKWLQRVRKAFFPSRSARYIKGRRWPRLRMYNQKLFYSLFNFPDRKAASRHFRKLNRRKGKTGGFAHSQTGLGDRLDVTLMHLNIAPTIFWARVVAPHGLLRINGKIVKDPAHRLSPGDFIQLEQERILRFRHFFKPVLNRRDEQNQPNKYSSGAYPANFTYYPGLRSMVYNGLPKESELRRSSRLNARLFRWFKLDSV